MNGKSTKPATLIYRIPDGNLVKGSSVRDNFDLNSPESYYAWSNRLDREWQNYVAIFRRENEREVRN